MAIPDFQSLMRPLLEALMIRESCNMKELTSLLSIQFGLNQSELEQLLPSGQQTVFHNRVGWAKTYLKAAGLVENATRGVVRITKNGRNFLPTHQGPINSKDLEAFESYREFKNKSTNNSISIDSTKPEDDVKLTPQERMESAFNESTESTKTELLERLKSCTPAFFERIVVELLLKMGYGGIAGRGQVTRYVNDGGIDGIIN